MTRSKLGIACIVLWIITLILFIVSGSLYGSVVNNLSGINIGTAAPSVYMDQIKQTNDMLTSSYTTGGIGIVFLFISIVLTIVWNERRIKH
jgi:hypothetical protein